MSIKFIYDSEVGCLMLTIVARKGSNPGGLRNTPDFHEVDTLERDEAWPNTPLGLHGIVVAAFLTKMIVIQHQYE